MGTGPGEIRTDGAGGLETRLPGSEGSLRSSGENGSSRELAGGSQVGGGPKLGAKPQVAAERLASVSASSEQQLLRTPCPHPCSGMGRLLVTTTAAAGGADRGWRGAWAGEKTGAEKRQVP